MKLYSWVENEKHTGKTQGGNKHLDITLDYEENGQDWRSNTSSHQLAFKVFFANSDDAHPTIFIWGNKNYQVVDKR
tara:strand:+ start:875 stop:1102 length:228 start_codon:yes stop_codon:yes gene_type:complete